MLTWMSRAVSLLPLLSALFSTIRSRMRSRDKYAQCLVASHEVAAEIYKYRCRTLEYDMTSSSLAAEAAGVAEEEEKGGKSPEQLKRELFIARVQNIYARAMDGELSSGGALRHTGFLAANIEAPRERAVFVEKLRAHVLTNVYEARLKARKELLEEYEEQRAEQAHDGGEKKPKVRTVEPDDLATLVDIFQQTADALAQMHDRGFVHADMKPHNVIVGVDLDGNHTAKLIDLGQSCKIGTIKKRIQGTPDYIAPEQVHRREITPKTDIYNFGATMYWVLTGKNIPTAMGHQKDSLMGSLDDSLIEKATPVSEINPLVPDRLNDIIMACVEVDIDRRPESMHFVADKLDMILGVLRAESMTQAD